MCADMTLARFFIVTNLGATLCSLALWWNVRTCRGRKGRQSTMNTYVRLMARNSPYSSHLSTWQFAITNSLPLEEAPSSSSESRAKECVDVCRYNRYVLRRIDKTQHKLCLEFLENICQHLANNVKFNSTYTLKVRVETETSLSQMNGAFSPRILVR